MSDVCRELYGFKSCYVFRCRRCSFYLFFFTFLFGAFSFCLKRFGISSLKIAPRVCYSKLLTVTFSSLFFLIQYTIGIIFRLGANITLKFLNLSYVRRLKCPRHKIAVIKCPRFSLRIIIFTVPFPLSSRPKLPHKCMSSPDKSHDPIFSPTMQKSKYQRSASKKDTSKINLVFFN